MESKRMIHLLERIMESVDCTYLSDLRLPDQKAKVKLAVESIFSEDYLPQVWNEAIIYILGEKVEFKDPDQAREFLLNNL